MSECLIESFHNLHYCEQQIFWVFIYLNKKNKKKKERGNYKMAVL